MTVLGGGEGGVCKDPGIPAPATSASGVTVSNPVCFYLGFPRGLSKTFENKQMRKCPKTILAVYSDTVGTVGHSCPSPSPFVV